VKRGANAAALRSLSGLGQVAKLRATPPRQAATSGKAWTTAWNWSPKLGCGAELVGLAWVAYIDKDMTRAVRLIAAAESIRESIGAGGRLTYRCKSTLIWATSAPASVKRRSPDYGMKAKV